MWNECVCVCVRGSSATTNISRIGSFVATPNKNAPKEINENRMMTSIDLRYEQLGFIELRGYHSERAHGRELHDVSSITQ